MIILFLASLGLHLFIHHPLLAEQDPVVKAGSQDIPWRIKADNIEVDKNQTALLATGQVSITKGNNTLNSDYAYYNWETREMYLRDNFDAEMDSVLLKAEQAQFDLKTEKGWIKQGNISLRDPQLILRGDKISKTGRQKYAFSNANITACDGDPPVWSIRSAQGNVPLNGYASLWHTKFLIKDYPVFYFPYLILPIKKEQQSGFLLPNLSSSSRDGIGITLPYYYMINSEQDMTLAANIINKRGTRLISEYRLVPDPESKGLFRFDWLKDRITADTETEEYEKFNNDGLIRDNSNRFWLRGKYNGFLGDTQWRTRLDLDMVSDQNYLREFDYGRYGYDSSQNDFLDEFGRDINDKDSILRENTWIIRKMISNNAEFESRVEYNQNSSTFNQNYSNDQDPTIQKFPELSLNVYKNKIQGTPFQWEAENDLTYYWRRSGNKGMKLNAYPSITLPLNCKHVSSILKAGWEEALYYNQDTGKKSAGEKEFITRGTASMHASLFSNMFNTFEIEPNTELLAQKKYSGNAAWTKIKHSIRPQVEYEYQSSEGNDVPEFALQDTRISKNKITYSLTNSFTRKKSTVVPQTEGQQDTGFKVDTEYRNFLLLDLEQSYHIKESHRDHQLSQYPRRRFSDIRARLIYDPASFINLETNTWFSPTIGELTEQENILNLNYRNRLAGYLGFDYQKGLDHYIHRKNQSKLSILRLGGEWDLNNQWTFRIDYSRDLDQSDLLERSLGIDYTHQCWGFDLELTQDSHETNISLNVNLSEIGEHF